MNERILMAGVDVATQSSLLPVLSAQGYACDAAATVDECLRKMQAAAYHLVLLDRSLLDEKYDAIRLLTRKDPDLGLLLVIDELDVNLAVDGGRRGAYDFITRPFEPAKIPIRLQVALERRKRAVDDRVYRLALENRINSRTAEVWDKKMKLQAQMLNTIRALNKALQAKHGYTEGHSKRVAEVAVSVARALKLTPADVNIIELGALFHDIGKIGIRDEILNKPSSLTDSEYEHVKAHPLIAEEILSPLEELRPIMEIVRHEHERWDGSGYPYGLKGEEIPLGARIVAVADVWDALVTVRSYKKAMPREQALAEIRRGIGTHFDPKLVQVFCDLMEGRIASRRDSTTRFLPAGGDNGNGDAAPDASTAVSASGPVK